MGNNRMVLINLTMYEAIHPFDLALYDDSVYWTDWGYTTLLRVHETGRGEQNFGPQIFQQAGGIHIQEGSQHFIDFLSEKKNEFGGEQDPINSRTNSSDFTDASSHMKCTARSFTSF